MRERFESPFLDTEEAAHYLKLDPKTLHNFRWRGGGPPYRKHGGKAVYHVDSLLAWSARLEMESLEPTEKTGTNHG